MDTGEICDILSALGQPTRLEVVRCLAPFSAGVDARGLPAGEISRRLGLPPATLSFHLKELLFKGIVAQTRAGRRLYYRIEMDRLVEALDYLVANVCEVAAREERAE